MVRGNKRQYKADRISDLPDSIIQHILSFLPSTKESIQTGILSKRWWNQWSYVPILIFNFQECDIDDKDSPRWVDDTLSLYNSSKLDKFHISYRPIGDTNFTAKIRFATRRNVEELLLDCGDSINATDAYMLPKFIFNNAFLVKLTILHCRFPLSRRVNWSSLKALTMDCYFLKDTSGLIEKVLSGSPSLESLTIWFFITNNPVTIASKSLKILNFLHHIDITHDLEISCPNLEELSVFLYNMKHPSIFPGKTLLNVLSRSPLLHSLKFNCLLEPLVIASKSLKKLVLYTLLCAIEVSCPNLEELDWCGSDFEKSKLINLPASCFASLNFVTPDQLEGSCGDNLARKILVELQQVNELEVRNWFIKVFSALKMQEKPNPLLKVKHLTLDSPYFGYVLGIVKGLCCSPMLERLVIKLHVYQTADNCDLRLENSQIPERPAYTYYHLKTVKIIGLSKNDKQCWLILFFVGFLLKNARALEKITIILEDGGGKDFLIEVSRILLTLQRCSKHAIIELL